MNNSDIDATIVMNKDQYIFLLNTGHILVTNFIIRNPRDDFFFDFMKFTIQAFVYKVNKIYYNDNSKR